MTEGQDLPVVAVLGRPNVGKSTLFNRIVGGRRAIVDGRPGVTRDRIEAVADWDGRRFLLVDTGGFEEALGEDLLSDRVRSQSLHAASKADVIIFVVDARTEPLPVDAEVARHLARFQRPVLLAANKVDGEKQEVFALTLYELGLGEPIAVSAEHGRGVNSLLDRVVAALPPGKEVELRPENLRLALLGRPNVGKSSILNCLTGEDRMVVHELAGTTRDSVDTTIEHAGERILLVDTAGIRRRSRVEQGVERASVSRALRAAERADVALLVFDVTEGVADQDARLARLVQERGRALILVGNKWDKLAVGDRQVRDRIAQIREPYAHLAAVPAIFVSALQGTGIDRLLPEAIELARRFRTRLPTRGLNEAIAEWTTAVEPPMVRGKRARIYYVSSVAASPPTIVLFVNDRTRFTIAYLRYLENRIRQTWPLEGIPLRMKIRNRERRDLTRRRTGSSPPGRKAAKVRKNASRTA